MKQYFLPFDPHLPLFVILSTGIAARARLLQIEGSLVDSLRQPIEVFDVEAFRADSTMVASGAFVRGDFLLTFPEAAAWIMVRPIGYRTQTIEEDREEMQAVSDNEPC